MYMSAPQEKELVLMHLQNMDSVLGSLHPIPGSTADVVECQIS